MTVFATVIAITKDLSDVEGDLKYNIKTFATQLGVRGVAFLGDVFQGALLYPSSWHSILSANSTWACWGESRSSLKWRGLRRWTGKGWNSRPSCGLELRLIFSRAALLSKLWPCRFRTAHWQLRGSSPVGSQTSLGLQSASHGWLPHFASGGSPVCNTSAWGSQVQPPEHSDILSIHLECFLCWVLPTAVPMKAV